MAIAKIVPAAAVSGVCRTDGTRVFVGDQELCGVFRITIEANYVDAVIESVPGCE